MDEEKNLNEDGGPVEEPEMAYNPEQSYAENPSEAPQQAEVTDPFEAVDPINVPDPAEYVAPSEVFESPEATEATEVVEVPEVTETTEIIEEPIAVIIPTTELVSAPVQSDRPQSFDMVQTPVAKEASEPTVTEQTVVPTVLIAETQTVKPAKKHGFKTILLILLILILMAASAAGAYFYRDSVASDAQKKNDASILDLKKTNTDLTAKLANEVAKNTLTTDQAVSTVATPSAVTIANIKASITSKNTAALEGYMAPTVNVVIAASEGGSGVVTSTTAVTDITGFIVDATSPWDFGLTASVLSTYSKGGYKQYFPVNAVVGKSANKKVISFSFNSDAKISTVFLSANESLLE